MHDVVAVQRLRGGVLLGAELGDDKGRAGDVGDLGHVSPPSSAGARKSRGGGREWRTQRGAAVTRETCGRGTQQGSSVEDPAERPAQLVCAIALVAAPMREDYALGVPGEHLLDPDAQILSAKRQPEVAWQAATRVENSAHAGEPAPPETKLAGLEVFDQ